MKIQRHYRTRSRVVVRSDYNRVLNDGEFMRRLCYKRHGFHKSGLAIAHMQICKKESDPLRFFVTVEGDIYMNPKIVSTRGEKKKVQEGCLSYPYRNTTKVSRYPEISVKVQMFDEDIYEKTEELVSVTKTLALSGIQAQVFQHEIEHMNGISVWQR